MKGKLRGLPGREASYQNNSFIYRLPPPGKPPFVEPIVVTTPEIVKLVPSVPVEWDPPE